MSKRNYDRDKLVNNVDGDLDDWVTGFNIKAFAFERARTLKQFAYIRISSYEM